MNRGGYLAEHSNTLVVSWYTKSAEVGIHFDHEKVAQDAVVLIDDGTIFAYAKSRSICGERLPVIAHQLWDTELPPEVLSDRIRDVSGCSPEVVIKYIERTAPQQDIVALLRQRLAKEVLVQDFEIMETGREFWTAAEITFPDQRALERAQNLVLRYDDISGLYTAAM